MKKNGLKALLLTDWYTMKLMYIVIIVMTVCGGGFSLTYAASNGGYIPTVMMFSGAMSSMFLSTIFAYDEYKNIGVMKKTMPYTCREMVLARYLQPAVIAAASAALNIGGAVIGGAIHGSFSAQFGGQIAFSVWLTALYILGIPTFFYPFFFTIGYRRMQYAFSIFATLFVMGGVIASFLGGTIDFMFNSIDEDNIPLLTMPVPVGIILTAVIAGLYYLSYRVTVAKYATSDN